MTEEIPEDRRSFMAPLIFTLVFAFHFISNWFERLKKMGNSREAQLRQEIKQLLKEASALSQPSTFAQASKLRRQAAAKQKELTQLQESVRKEAKTSFNLYLKILSFVKVAAYILLTLWFWRTPVASISKQLVHPFGKLLAWGAGGGLNDNVMVGVIPWLILCTRVSKFVLRVVKW